MTWQESFDHAIAHNSKLPTLAEAKEIIRQNLGKSLIIGDFWVPVGDSLLNKDWVQIGDGHAVSLPGSSFIEDNNVYPVWGDDSL